jgi:3-oxoacyl-[acyl-carrier protein] reductase
MSTNSETAKARVALVTGASRGIGAACALALGQAGYKVAVHYRSQDDKAKAICDLLPSGMAMPIKLDLAAENACQELVKAVKDELGSLDVLVNNAGIAIDQLLPFAKLEDFDQLLSTNLKPVFLLSKFACKQMIRQKGGRIINISSVVGYSGNAGQSMYAATKAAITGFTKSIALELASFNILANCVAPGFIETDMTQGLPEEAKAAILAKVPLKRLGKPEDIASAVVFLASPQAAYITGSTLHVNGGMFTT